MNQVRVQILLEPRQHKALKKAARRANKSMSELIRQITDDYLSRNAPDQEDEVLQALKNLKQIRERQPLYEGNPVAEARQEREHG
jgi:metal-responsive CopG/Arc/MetJ family transcriptional regulator